jgi:hypothetical protein
VIQPVDDELRHFLASRPITLVELFPGKRLPESHSLEVIEITPNTNVARLSSHIVDNLNYLAVG